MALTPPGFFRFLFPWQMYYEIADSLYGITHCLMNPTFLCILTNSGTYK